MNFYPPRPPTCINRNVYPICYRPILDHRDHQTNIRPVLNPYQYRPIQLPLAYDRNLQGGCQCNQPVFPHGIGEKRRRPQVRPQKWINCEFEGDDEITTTEIPVNIKLGPEDATNKNLQLTLNLKLMPKGTEPIIRKKRGRCKEFFGFFTKFWRGKRDDASSLGMRDLMARMVGALDDIRCALKDMKKGQDEFVGAISPRPSKGIEKRPIDKDSDRDDKKRNKSKKFDEQCQTEEDDESQNKQIKDTNKNHMKDANTSTDSNDEPESKHSVSMKTDTLTSSDSSGKTTEETLESNTSSDFTSPDQSPSIDSVASPSNKSESSNSVSKDIYKNDQTINYAFTHTTKPKISKKEKDKDITSKLDDVAAATLRLQQMVSVPVTRKVIPKSSSSFEDILLRQRDTYPVIFSNKSEFGFNMDSESLLASPEQYIQPGRKSKNYRKRHSNYDQNILPEVLPTYTSVANLSLFSARKEAATDVASKRRKTVKGSNIYIDNDKANNVKKGASFNHNTRKQTNNYSSSTSSDQICNRQAQASSFSRKCKTMPQSLMNRYMNYTSSYKSPNLETNIPNGTYSNMSTGFSTRKEFPFADVSRSEDNNVRPYRRRKYASARKDNWDKTYPRLPAAGSSVNVTPARRSAISNPTDPADELLRAVLQRKRD